MKNKQLIGLIGLVSLISGCKSIDEKSAAFLYEKTTNPSNGIINERYFLSGSGKNLDEIYKRFDKIYRKTNRFESYDEEVIVPRKKDFERQRRL